MLPGKNGAWKADTSGTNTGIRMQCPAPVTGLFNSPFHIHAWYLAIQDVHLQLTHFTNTRSHLPEANRCKLSLTPPLSSLHMEAGVKPTSRPRSELSLALTLMPLLWAAQTPDPFAPISAPHRAYCSHHAPALPRLEMETGSRYQANLRAPELEQWPLKRVMRAWICFKRWNTWLQDQEANH